MTSSTASISMDDDEISLHLDSQNPDDRQMGFAAAIQRFKWPLLDYARKRGVQRIEDREEIVSTVFRQLHQKLEDGSFSLRQSLSSQVYQITQRRCIDLLRRQCRRIPDAPQDEYVDEVANRLADSGALQQWRILVETGTASEILEVFWKALPDLPPRQQAVATAVAVLFKKNGTYSVEDIRNAVEEITGESTTIGAVKEAWKIVRKQLRELLPGLL